MSHRRQSKPTRTGFERDGWEHTTRPQNNIIPRLHGSAVADAESVSKRKSMKRSRQVPAEGCSRSRPDPVDRKAPSHAAHSHDKRQRRQPGTTAGTHAVTAAKQVHYQKPKLCASQGN